MAAEYCVRDSRNVFILLLLLCASDGGPHRQVAGKQNIRHPGRNPVTYNTVGKLLNLKNVAVWWANHVQIVLSPRKKFTKLSYRA
jgi:hypothetical protein